MCERVVRMARYGLSLPRGFRKGRLGVLVFPFSPLDEEQDLKTDAPLE
jgi:hypothetical protein